MKRPAISIIVPVYNTEKFLRECLDSIRGQSFRDFEVICVNDGSTDGSLDILKDFADRDERFKIVTQKNQGVNSARSVGYEKARGEYVAWVDSDDYIEKNMYDKMYSLAIKNKCDVVVCNYAFYPKKISNKEKWYRPYLGQLDWRFVSHNTVQWNKIVKKSLLDKLNIMEMFDKFGEGCYSIVLMSANKVLTIDDELYNYRVGHESLSNNHGDVNWYIKTVDRARNKYEYIKDNNYSKEWQDFFFFVYLRYNLILVIVAALNGNKSTYNHARSIVKSGKLFSKKNAEYLSDSFSRVKLFVLKNIVMKNFYLAHVVCMGVMR